jgi:alcohol dehydrogenase class IV
MVIGFGGGSALDAGKAIAIMMTNPGELLDYLEVIGHGRLFERASARYAAIPTTAGTGSEVTRNAVLFSPEHGIKVSLRSPFMLPCLAIVDPDTTISLPPSLTAQTGLDALTQLIEPYVCSRSNPMVDALCRDGIRRVAASLRRAYETGSNATARTDMALASMFGGMALANAGLGAVHGLAAPLGGLTRAPHGAICARLLPFVMETNIRALESRAPASPALARYDEVAQLLLGDANAKRGDGVKWVFEICAVLAIQPLAHYGLTKNQVPAIVAQAQKASSMKANPILLTDQELTAILMQAID